MRQYSTHSDPHILIFIHYINMLHDKITYILFFITVTFHYLNFYQVGGYNICFTSNYNIFNMPTHRVILDPS
jgi:hypothetical protein